MRVAVLMAAALLPLGTISTYFGWRIVDDAMQAERRLMLSRAGSELSDTRQLLSYADGASEALAAALPPLLGDESCDAVLDAYVERRPRLSSALVLGPAGDTLCASAETGPATPSIDDELPTGATVFLRAPPDLVGNTLATRTPIVFDGGVAGYVIIRLQSDAPARAIDPSPFETVALNEVGQVLLSSIPPADLPGMLPDSLDPRRIDALAGRTFRSASKDGSARRYAVFALIPGHVWGLAIAPAGTLSTVTALERWGLLFFPLVILVAGIATAAYGMEYMVARHVRRLREGMRAFALGERQNAMVALDGAPEELETTAVAYNRMTRVVSRAEERGATDLEEKRVLLREVHHRVKNNLQLISSMISMQRRAVRDVPEAREVLDRLQRRVQGLGSIHRNLFVDQERPAVDAAAVVEQLARDAEATARGAGRDVRIRVDAQALDLFPDQAVPLSMVLAELLHNAARFCATADETDEATIQVVLREEGGNVLVRVANAVPAGTPRDGERMAGIGRKLIDAFAMQLEGRVDEDRSRTHHVVTLSFTRQTEALPDNDY
jgi:two-component sensor histidine kinase